MSEGWRGCLQGFAQLMEMWLEKETCRYKRSAAFKRTILHRNTQPRGDDRRALPRHTRPIPSSLLDRLLPQSLQISTIQPDLAPSVLAPIRYSSVAFVKIIIFFFLSLLSNNPGPSLLHFLTPWAWNGGYRLQIRKSKRSQNQNKTTNKPTKKPRTGWSVTKN